MVIAPGEHRPLGLRGPPGEDVRHQTAVVALGLEGVEIPVDVRGKLLQGEIAEVAVGFQLQADEVDLALWGDVRVGVLGQGLLCRR